MAGSRKSRKSREESSAYRPVFSPEERKIRARRSLAAHYRRSAAARELKNQRTREWRLLKKLERQKAKRSWDEPRAKKAVEVESEDEEGVDDEMERMSSPATGNPRERTPTLQEIDVEQDSPREPLGWEGEIEEDEELASQVLTTMLLERQRESRTRTPPREATTMAAAETRACLPPGTQRPRWSPLPPSSPPPPSSPEETEDHGPAQPKRRGWVSPGEWDEPGSPLPSGVGRMPWPQLFKRWARKGDAGRDDE
ncbi:hypothetical protein B0H15DRAFT_947474 [Mycena belliarum]|uniref:Uncharacterized protein n=1 Tax=Mycena belliarum TaxID=1033014 RepID=A0AAD6UAD3_9AGAR|nr:hypothetical protein B0H15DRAFT_947474 [Mycena belliae]